MPKPINRITKDDFGGIVKRVTKTPYIPIKITKEMKDSGADEYFRHSATKDQTIETIKDLQDKGLMSKLRPAEKLYRDQLREQLSEEGTVSKVNLASEHIPNKLAEKDFLRYIASSTNAQTSARLKTVLQRMGLSSRESLNKDQMTRILKALRAEPDIYIPSGLGKVLKVKERLRQAFVKGAIADELTEEESRYNYNADKSMPGVLQMASSRAASSISRTGNKNPSAQRGTSISRSGATGQKDSIDDESSHPTSSAAHAQKKPGNGSAGGTQADKKSQAVHEMYLE